MEGAPENRLCMRLSRGTHDAVNGVQVEDVAA